MRWKTRLLWLVATLSLSGCGTTTILVPPGVTCTLAKEYRNVPAFVPDAKGELKKTVVQRVPAGVLFKIPKEELQNGPKGDQGVVPAVRDSDGAQAGDGRR